MNTSKVNRIVCVCGNTRFNFRTKKYMKALSKVSIFDATKDSVVVKRAPMTKRDIERSTMHANAFKSEGWKRSPNEARKAFKTEMANAMGDYVIHLFLAGNEFNKTPQFQKPHWVGAASDHPMYWEKGYKAPDKTERQTFDTVYKGIKLSDMPAVSSLSAAGVYMPDINLHKGFNSVVDKARDSLKRELVKSERKPLFKAFVRACNAYQLIQLPNQTIPPFNVCGGAVWDACEGSINKFSVLVDKTMQSLFGRTMTVKEGIFIKEQWPALTRARRASGSPIRETRNDSDFVSVGRTMGELWKRGAEYTKAVVLGNAQGTRADNSLGALYFDYRGEVAALRKRLAAGEITHAYYNELYAMLKNKRAKQLEILETVAHKNMRNQHKNSGAVRVVHNAQGMGTEKAPNASKRFAYDDYPITDDDNDDDKLIIENMKSPTVYKDGIVTNKNSREPIIIHKKRRTINKPA